MTGVNRLRRGHDRDRRHLVAGPVASSGRWPRSGPAASAPWSCSLDPAQFEPEPDEAAAEAAAPAHPRAPPRPGRVRDPHLRHRAAAGPRGGPGPMTIDGTRIRRPEEGWVTLALVDGDRDHARLGRGRPGLGQRQGRAHRRPPARRGARRRSFGFMGPKLGLGPLDDAPRRRAVRRPADPDPRGLRGPLERVARLGVPVHRRRHGRTPTSTSPGASSSSRARRSTTSLFLRDRAVGDDAVRRRTRCSGTAGR